MTTHRNRSNKGRQDNGGWPRGGVTFLCFLLATALAWPLFSDDQPLSFAEMIDVRVVNIEAVVTDRNGLRVHGLTPNDFKLMVDGEEKSIDYFTEVRGRTAIEREEETAETSAVPAVEPGEPVGTSYLLFIDDFFSIAAHRNQVLESLEKQLPLLSERDRMAIVAFDGERLEMLSSWTNSANDLTEALSAARERTAHGLERLSELRINDRQVDAFDSAFDPFHLQLEGVELDYAWRLADQLSRSVTAAATAMRGFASPPGRNVMMLLSGGWPYSPAEYTVSTFFSDFHDRLAGFYETGELGGRAALYEPITDTANLLGYTVYPVDVPGMLHQGEDERADASRAVPGPIHTLHYDREKQVEATLYHLAEQTGGKALINSQRTHALREAVSDTRSYYWLGFQPKRQDDDKRHDLKLQVLKPGMKVRTRDDFVDLSREKEIDLMVQSALLFGNPPTTQPLDLEFGEMTRQGGKVHLPLEVGIPMDNVFLHESEGRYQGQLEVRIQAMDEKGNVSATHTEQISIDQPTPPKSGQRFWYETTLKMRPTTERLVVAVYDPLSGRVLSGLSEMKRLDDAS